MSTRAKHKADDATSVAAGRTTATGRDGRTDPARFVVVRGAREHNLKDVDVEIPRNALVVFTGISGSGKSSLAFGTLYAEAQRRYLESVAPYARRLIDQAGVPDVDSIDGLPPAVALQQQRGTPSTRSSVGSVTTISSLLRILYSRAGRYPAKQPMLYAEDFSPNTPQGACPTCHGLGRVYEVTEASMVPDDSLTIRERAVAAWPPAWHGQNLRDILVTLGVDVDTPWRDLPRKDRDWILYTEEQPTVPVYAGLTPEQTRAALKAKREPSYQGTFTGVRKYVLQTYATTQSALMKKRVSRFMVGSLCPECHGKRLKRESLGVTFAGLDIGALSQLPLTELARLLEPIAGGEADAHDGDGATRGKGGPNRAAGRPHGEAGAAESVLTRAESRRNVEQRIAAGGSAHAAAPDVRLTADQSAEKRIAAQRISHDVLVRLRSLNELGLGYLSLDRTTPTLSPGELQRLRLATQIRSNLFGVVYVLDEPSAGLHPADGEALMGALDELKAAGNSLFVVEHDVAVMRRADWLVDVGPGAGELGGRVLYSGPPDGLSAVRESRTARYLDDTTRTQPTAAASREIGHWLRLEGVTRNNLNQLGAAFPIGLMTTVTGVSGSGKSSLVSQALIDLVAAELARLSGARAGSAAPEGENDEPDDASSPKAGQAKAAALQAGGSSSLLDDDGDLEPELRVATAGRIASGLGAIRRLIQVDQKPIGRTPRSNLATYTGLFDQVRKLFAATPQARKLRFDAGRFSFNVAKGRCETCEGEGFVSVELLFMPSVYAPCPTCHGLRYNEETLAVTLRDRSIADVLGMTVDEGCAFWQDEASVRRPLELLRDIGLGYLRLGQPATELSGGEAQRIKLATELQRAQRGHTLYVLDEPTTGLHPSDVDKLMVQLHGLVDAGHTVVLVEHEMRVAAGSDWVIDIGPGAGAEGGRIVAQGRPAEVAASTESRTAPYLRSALK